MRKNLPEEYRRDIEKAVTILKAEKCTEVFLFGSLVGEGLQHDNTDIDIAVRGIPKSRFFTVYGMLMISLSHPVDLVDLDSDTLFARMLMEKGHLYRVA